MNIDTYKEAVANIYKSNTISTYKNTKRISYVEIEQKENNQSAAIIDFSKKTRQQITNLKTPDKNKNEDISLIQTAEEGLRESNKVLRRMRELVVESVKNYPYFDKMGITKEICSLKDELNSIVQKVNYNRMQLLDGSQKELSIDNMGSNNLGDRDIGYYISDINTSTFGNASSAINVIDKAIEQVSTAINNLKTSEQEIINKSKNKEESDIKNINMAKEMMKSTKHNIMANSSQAMMAQSQYVGENVIHLLKHL